MLVFWRKPFAAQAQTYPDVEILFIDDGSTDNSLDVARQFDITILAQKNQGVCGVRNNALTLAKGEYVLFLDADDILMPTAVESLYTWMRGSEANIGYVYGQMEYFDRKTGLKTAGSAPRRWQKEITFR